MDSTTKVLLIALVGAGAAVAYLIISKQQQTSQAQQAAAAANQQANDAAAAQLAQLQKEKANQQASTSLKSGGERVHINAVDETKQVTAACAVSDQYPFFQTVEWGADGHVTHDATKINSLCQGQNPCIFTVLNDIFDKDPYEHHHKQFTGDYFCKGK